MYPISNEKFWTSRKESGFVVGSGDNELTRDDLPYATARLIRAAPDLLREAQLLVSRLQMMAIHPSHYATLAAVVRQATPKTPKDA